MVKMCIIIQATDYQKNGPSGPDPTRRLVYCLIVSTLVLFISPHLGAKKYPFERKYLHSLHLWIEMENSEGAITSLLSAGEIMGLFVTSCLH